MRNVWETGTGIVEEHLFSPTNVPPMKGLGKAASDGR
jgi:hypothetical protein